ncbi:peptide deformylase [Patescibacteria group bacterium]|jgi:peptide deformylase|nr:peptide deformylase [Patescibacteria group bacterium]
MENLEFLPTSAPSLRERSRELEVSEVTVPEFQLYLDALIRKMIEARGVGLASPQIGRNIRAVVVQPEPTDDPLVLINPVITKKSDALLESEEGCFSVPGTYGLVKRHKKVTVEALNRHGRRIEFEAKNFPAFVVQHEIDHLDGILFIDKAEKTVELDEKGNVKKRVK